MTTYCFFISRPILTLFHPGFLVPCSTGGWKAGTFKLGMMIDMLDMKRSVQNWTLKT